MATILADNALCTLREVRNFMDKKGIVSEDDDMIKFFINSTSSLFETVAGRKFKSAEYTDVLDGRGTPKLFMVNAPILSISSVHESSDGTWDADTLVDADDYRFCDDYVFFPYSYFTAGVKNYQVVYTAGYASVPTDINEACIEEVVRKFKHRKDFDVTSKTQPDGDVVYVEKGLLTITKLILDLYNPSSSKLGG